MFSFFFRLVRDAHPFTDCTLWPMCLHLWVLCARIDKYRSWTECRTTVVQSHERLVLALLLPLRITIYSSDHERERYTESKKKEKEIPSLPMVFSNRIHIGIVSARTKSHGPWAQHTHTTRWDLSTKFTWTWIADWIGRRAAFYSPDPYIRAYRSHASCRSLCYRWNIMREIQTPNRQTNGRRGNTTAPEKKKEKRIAWKTMLTAFHRGHECVCAWRARLSLWRIRIVGNWSANGQ